MPHDDSLQPTGSLNDVALGAELLAAGDEQLIHELNEAAERFGAAKAYRGAPAIDMALAYVAGMHNLPPERLFWLEKLWRI